jgi:transposase
VQAHPSEIPQAVETLRDGASFRKSREAVLFKTWSAKRNRLRLYNLATLPAYQICTKLEEEPIKTLRAWMKKADASGIYRMQRFVRTFKQDQSAVEAAVEQSWSNGPVEGHINRLKTLKRQMYGRAGFELLRARVLPLPPPGNLHQT